MTQVNTSEADSSNLSFFSSYDHGVPRPLDILSITSPLMFLIFLAATHGAQHPAVSLSQCILDHSERVILKGQ